MENTETAMAKKSRVGRPAMSDEEKAVLVPIRFSPDLLEIIDKELASRIDRPSRSAVIRDLVIDGLGVRGWKVRASDKGKVRR